MAGIAPLISGTHIDKIDFSMKLFDMDSTGILRASEMMNVLSQMNRVASYFGDPVMAEDQIHTVITDVLEKLGASSIITNLVGNKENPYETIGQFVMMRNRRK